MRWAFMEVILVSLGFFLGVIFQSNLKAFLAPSPHTGCSIGSDWYEDRNKAYSKALIVQKQQSRKLLDREYSEMQEYNTVFRSKSELCEKAIYHLDLPFPYFIYKPLWNCPYVERVGEIFDGGKWLCNVPRLAKLTKCVIYSFGSNGKTQFETNLHARTNCEIHIFDPTVALVGLAQNIYFHPWCLSGTDGTCKIGETTYPSFSVETIMKKLSHSRINLLKIDVDGYELEVLDKMSPTCLDRVDEVSIEFHWQGLNGFVNAMDKLQRAGFRVFYNEPNLFYYTLPAAGIEYSLVRPEYTL